MHLTLLGSTAVDGCLATAAGYMLNLVAKHLKPTEIGSLRESFLAMVRRISLSLRSYFKGRTIQPL